MHQIQYVDISFCSANLSLNFYTKFKKLKNRKIQKVKKQINQIKTENQEKDENHQIKFWWIRA